MTRKLFVCDFLSSTLISSWLLKARSRVSPGGMRHAACGAVWGSGLDISVSPHAHQIGPSSCFRVSGNGDGSGVGSLLINNSRVKVSRRC